jgi:hypothetical protein
LFLVKPSQCILANHFILIILQLVYLRFISLNFHNLFCELRLFILWAWGSLGFFLSTFRVLHIVFFEFLLILESLRVFNFIFSTLDSLGFNYFFGVKFGGLWFWSYEHPQFSILCFWSLGVFNFLLVILGGLWISFGELWGIFCFFVLEKVQGFLNFILWTLGALFLPMAIS